MADTAGVERKQYFHICVFFLIFILGWILPPMGIPAVGMRVGAVFLAMLYGWSFIGFAWPSMVCMIALGYSGYADPGTVLGRAFSHPAVLFTMIVLVFTRYCDKSGLNEYMSRWLISRPYLAGRPWLFTNFVLTGTLIIGFLIDGVPAVFLISGLLYTVFEDIGFKRGDRYPAFLLAGVCIAGVQSFACKPWMGQNILGLNALNEVSGGGIDISYLTVIGATMPICILSMLVYALVMRYIFKPDVKPLSQISPEYLAEIRSSLNLAREQKIAAFFLCLFLVFMLLPTLLPRGTAIFDIFSKINMTVAITIIVAILSFTTVGGKGVFDFQDCSSGINWNIVWMLAASIPVSAALSNNDVGIAPVLTESLRGITAGGSPVMFVCIFTILASVLTQITHNVTIVLVSVPLMWNLAPSTGINPAGFLLMLFLSAGAAFATPAASTVGALSFANGEWIGVRRAFQAGIAAWLGALLCTLVVGLPLIEMMAGI